MVATRESLLTASAVKLYGRVIQGLNIDVAGARNELGANMFLRNQLDAATHPHLARIYGFSYEGRYTPLSRPAIFLVHGDGTPAVDGDSAAQPVDLTGKAYGTGIFASDIMVWEYDRGDFSLRLDVNSGPLERILIDAEERGEAPPYFRESKTRLRGPGE